MLLAIAGSTAAFGAEPVSFNRDIRPILSDLCYTCHGPDAGHRATELRFDVEESVKSDLGGYRAVVPGKRGESELWKRITSRDPDVQMPPADAGRRLTPQQIETLGRWIDAGADWQKHWSFLPPERPPLPNVKDTAWPRNAIDRFILERLERNGLTRSPEASKETLIRRVTLALTGVPPTLEEIDGFLADDSPDAYEKLVDRLLASPRYGERMILECLDAARYSDTNGYQTDGTRAMWPWRDWVLDALNGNMPFDQFTVEQLAGDLMAEPRGPEGRATAAQALGINDPALRRKIASGFHRNHMLNGEGGRIAEESRVEYVVDRVDTTATIWLGLTLGCARCHDHKYDPLTQKEFYQLSAYFNQVNETGGVDRRSSTAAPTLELPTPEQSQKIDQLSEQIAGLEQQLKGITEKLTAEQPAWEQSVDRTGLPENVAAALSVESAKRSEDQKKLIADHYLAPSNERKEIETKLDAARKQLTNTKNAVLITMVMEDRAQKRDTFVLIRGAYDKYGEKVTTGTPAVLPPLPEDAPANRLALAEWIVSRDHPLTARVTVNRLWQQFFGTGLVKTSEDFGAQGELPSHPALLDWLAVEFQGEPEGDSPAWEMKHLVRLIVTSATFRQSARVTTERLERDPEARLLSRFPRRRLNSHVLRDQALAVAGLLVERLGGPPVKPYQPPGLWEEFSFGKIKYEQDHGEKLYRRSLYTFWRRSVAPTTLFDTSPRNVCTVRQPQTNTPLQALTLLNDTTFTEAARVFAARILATEGTDDDRLTFAFRAAAGRRPDEPERAILRGRLDRLRKQYEADREAAARLVATGEAPRDERLDAIEHAAWTGLAMLLLNLDEVVSLE